MTFTHMLNHQSKRHEIYLHFLICTPLFCFTPFTSTSTT